MQQHAVLIGLHLISGILGVKGENIMFLIKYDHRDTPKNKKNLDDRGTAPALVKMPGLFKKGKERMEEAYLPPVEAMPSMNWRWKIM